MRKLRIAMRRGKRKIKRKMVPFTTTEFLRVFERYNNAIWPGQVLIYFVGLAAIGLILARHNLASKLVSLTLAFLWLWMGIVYHVLFFSTINRAAKLFGALFIIQSMIFIFAGVLSSRLSFKLRSDVRAVMGCVLMMYSLIVYPILGLALGHTYPAGPTFGVPCPTTIFTLSLLLAAGRNMRFYMVLIPVLWSLMGLWATISLRMYEDLGLVVAGLITVLLMRPKAKPILDKGVRTRPHLIISRRDSNTRPSA